MSGKSNVRNVAMGVAAALLMGGSAVALAQAGGAAKPLGKMTCGEFLQIDEVTKPKAVYFAVAYAAGGQPEAAMLNVQATEKLIPVLVTECKSKPNEAFYDKVKAQYAKSMGK